MYPILILHGWGHGNQSWQKVKELLEQKGYKVFVPDMPGFGQAPAPKDPWNVQNYMDWVLGFAQQNKLEKFFLLGHSFGGRVAIKLAAFHPEKIEKLLLEDSAGTAREKNLSFRQKLVSKFQWLGKIFSKLPFYYLFRKIAYRLAGVRDYYLIQNPVMKETFKKVINEDLTFHLADIKTPTLIIWGEKDKVVPLNVAYFLKENIEDSQLKIFPNIGHRPHYDCPEQLAEEIIKFIQ